MEITIEEGPYVKFTVEVTVIEGDPHPKQNNKTNKKGTNKWD